MGGEAEPQYVWIDPNSYLTYHTHDDCPKVKDTFLRVTLSSRLKARGHLCQDCAHYNNVRGVGEEQ